MDFLSIIKEAENLLPEEIINGTISFNQQKLPLREYLETEFIKHVRPGITPEYIAETIKTKFIDKINLATQVVEVKHDKVTYVRNFLNGLFDKKQEIRLSETTTISVEERLLEFIGEDFMFEVGPRKVTIEEYYMILLRNEYQPISLVEQAELCEYYIDKMPTEILDSVIPSIGLTVRKYLENLPNEMEGFDVRLNGEKISIDEAVSSIYEQQLEVIKKETEKKTIEHMPSLDELEQTSLFDNIMGVPEIEYRQTGNGIEIIQPQKPLPKLTDEELFNVRTYAEKEATLTEESVIQSINLLMDAVRKSSSDHDLTNIEKEVNELLMDIKDYVNNPYIKEKLNALENFISTKRKNIIIVENNKEDYIDVIQGKITSLRDRIRDCGELEIYDQVHGEMISLQSEVHKKGIKDFQLLATIEAFMSELSFKRLKADILTNNQSKDIERLKDQIEAYIRNVKLDYQSMAAENNQASIVGVQIRVENAYNNTLSFINDALRSGILTAEEAEYYRTQLDGAVNIQTEEKQKNR